MVAITATDLKFSYGAGPPVIDVPHFELKRGERVFLHGPSGSGKTTLLGLISGILPLQQGQLEMLGEDMSRMTPTAFDRFRGEHFGYIFQMFNLIPYLSVVENICLPCELNPRRRARVDGSLTQAAHDLANHLRIDDTIAKKDVTELSVGQQQRVAAARALMGAPEIIVADEPTSALDTEHRAVFVELLSTAAAQSNASVLFVSHDHQLAVQFDRSIPLASINKVESLRSG